MTVRHMKIFVQVYQCGNITRASQLLHMTQPAVTRAIQEIEGYYGVCLFERLGRRLAVTESGHALYPQALHIADSFDTMEKSLRNWDSFGILRVGASITLGNYLLPELVCRFQQQRPNLRVQATVRNGSFLQQALLDNRLDLALIEGETWEPELHTQAFDTDRLVPVFPPDHPLLAAKRLVLADLLEYPLLLREQGSVGRSFLEHIFAARGLRLEPLWESSSTQAVVKAVCCGLGVSILPEQLVRQDIADGRVATRPLDDQPLEREHFLVWHRQKFLTPTALQFIELCKAGL